MQALQVKLDTIENMKEFAFRLSKFDGEFELVSGTYKIGAKSITELFSIDLSNPIQLCFEAKDANVLMEISEFVV